MQAEREQNRKILVIEDKASIRELVADLLREFELADQVSEASSLGAAKQAITSSHWDAIITDMSLGDGNILDLFEQMQSAGQTLPPTLLMSGYLYEQSRQRAMDLGIQHILPKPFTPTHMIDCVMQMLDEK